MNKPPIKQKAPPVPPGKRPLRAPQLAIFLSNLEMTKELLDGGNTIRWVWLDLRAKGLTTYSYEAFRSRVRRHVQCRLPTAEIQPEAHPISRPPAPDNSAEKMAKEPTREPLSTPLEPTFRFTRNPKREDLL